MKRNTGLIVIGLAALSLAGGTLALARGGNHGERMVERLGERLELNDAQSASLQTLADEMRETRELMRGDTDSMSTQLQSLIATDTFDQGAALEMITERTTALQTQAPELVGAAAGFVDSLQPEQRQELRELMERFGDRGGRHGHGHGNNARDE